MVYAGVVDTPIQHSSICVGHRAAALAGTMSAVPDSSTIHDSIRFISCQFLLYHGQLFQNSKEN